VLRAYSAGKFLGPRSQAFSLGDNIVGFQPGRNGRRPHVAFDTLPVRIGLCQVASMKANAIVVVDPEIMSGTPCFAGTRVPARTLIDYIEGGDSLDDFLEDFPTVSRKQAIAFLEEASVRMLVTA